MAEVEAISSQDAGNLFNAIFAEEEKAAKPVPPKGPDGKFVAKPKEPEAEEEETPAVEDNQQVEGDEVEEPEPPRTVKVKVDGIEVEVDEEELKAGYSRTKDYTQKTQALAEAKRKFEAEEVAKVREERQTYADRLAAIEDALQALRPDKEPDWIEMRGQMTPEQFTETYTAWKANEQRLQRVQAEQARVRDLQEQDHQRTRAIRLAEERKKLEEAIPELKDPEKGEGLQSDLLAYAKSLGFTDEDIAGIEDNRPFVLLHKARLWDESQKRKPTVEAKIDRALDTMKPSATKSKPKTSALEQAKGQLATSGSIADAAKLFNLMGT